MNPNQRCIAHLEAGGLVLAPDLRQARILRRLHDRAQAGAGRQVWPTAQVLPLDAWLDGQWQRACADRTDLPGILAPVALRWIWGHQVGRDGPGQLDPASLGARARASWLKLREYGGGLADVTRWPLTRDQQAFLGWSRHVERELRERGACDAGDLARLLAESSVLPTRGPPILLAGFRRLTPAQSSLFAALAAAGRTIERLAPQPADGACFRHRAADPDSERHAMIAWLAARVAATPSGLHALIVPDLDANRGALERALAASLQPGLEIPGSQQEERVFDLAGGYPLAMQPVVDAALTALACATAAVDWSDASRLLLSRHLVAAETERDARITADLALREGLGSVRLRGSRLAAHAARSGAAQFATALGAALAALDGPGRRSAGRWAEAFGAALAACGWPGDGPLESREYQAARRFRELLQELAALATVTPALEVGEALAELRRLAAAQFQPESGEPAVFVLDAYEDPGVWLDSLWVAGLTATAWPRPVAVDPLLPIEIQRQLAMPGVTPEDCVADARAVLAGWRLRSGSLVLSWPQFENDTEVDGSRLLPPDAAELVPCAGRPTRERLAFEARQLEPLPEARLPPLATQQVTGGAKLLELQALCPFRAFAEMRLGASRLEVPGDGFDRRMRGIALHRALQDLWSRLVGQAALAALDLAERQRRIEQAVAVALGAVTPAGVGEPTVAIERDWQRQAIGRLLDLDLTRPPFEVVETERSFALVIGGLELRLRVDRVDRIGAELVVIDYKTGTTRASAWRGARMDSPQLPLYAVLHPERPTGIAFAAIGAAGAKYLGVGRDGEAIAGMKAAEKYPLTEDEQKGFGWAEITARWRAWLERLAADFAAGHAQVDPKLGADTCRSCHLAALCRVENAAPDEDGEGTEGE